MSNLNIIYKGANSGHLLTSYYDGSKWSGDSGIGEQPGGIDPQSSCTPGVAVFDNMLYVIYKAANSNHLLTSCYDGTKWYGDKEIGEQPGGIAPQSSCTPGAAVFNNKLYVVYKAANSNHLLTSCYDGSKWSGDNEIGEQPGGIAPQSSCAPGVAIFNNKLYVVYKGANSGHLLTSCYDGSKWSGDSGIGDQPGGIDPRSSCTPGVTVFNNMLYVIYKAANNNHLLTSCYDGTKWYGDNEIGEQPGGIAPQSSCTPGAAVFNNKLYVVYKAANSKHLLTSCYDGSKWSGDSEIGEQPGGIAPQSSCTPGVIVV